MASRGNARPRESTPIPRTLSKQVRPQSAPGGKKPAATIAQASVSPKRIAARIVDQVRCAIPSLTTLIAIGLGVSAIAKGRCSFSDLPDCDTAAESACWCIVAAFAIDFFDGALARALGACSAIGASLDFLADSTAYVLAPAVLLPALCGNIGWAFGALWLALGSYRCSRQEGEEVKGDRKAGRFYGLISNHAAVQLVLAIIVSMQWKLQLHRRPDVIVLFVLPLCMAMVSPVWYWKITYGPTWWKGFIYPFLLLVLACSYFKVGAEVLIVCNSLYILLGPTVDERLFVYLPTFANITCCLCGWLSIVVGTQCYPKVDLTRMGNMPGMFTWLQPMEGFFHDVRVTPTNGGIGAGCWAHPGWWICVAFAVDSVCALCTTHKSSRALRLQCGLVAFSIAPAFLFMGESSDSYSWLAGGSFLLCSLYRRTVAVSGQVDIAMESAKGVPSALSAAVVASIHFAGHTNVINYAGLAMSVAMIVPMACLRQDQARYPCGRWCIWICHFLNIMIMSIGFPSAAVLGLVGLTVASLTLAKPKDEDRMLASPKA